jgi:hypothetical protein
MKRHRSAFGGLRAWAWLGASLGILLGTGCSGKTSTITGTVTYRGKPLPSGVIKFINAANNEVIGGANISDGNYSVSGIPPGLAKIAISSLPPRNLSILGQPKDTAEGGPASKAVAIPPKYSNPDTSGLTYTIQPGTQLATPIDLQ